MGDGADRRSASLRAAAPKEWDPLHPHSAVAVEGRPKRARIHAHRMLYVALAIGALTTLFGAAVMVASRRRAAASCTANGEDSACDNRCHGSDAGSRARPNLALRALGDEVVTDHPGRPRSHWQTSGRGSRPPDRRCTWVVDRLPSDSHSSAASMIRRRVLSLRRSSAHQESECLLGANVIVSAPERYRNVPGAQDPPVGELVMPER